MPTPGGTNTLFHPQAGDLHTPNLCHGPNMGIPLSMPTTAEGAPAGTTMPQMDGFQTLAPHQFCHFNSFIQAQPSQQTLAPSSFVHQDTGYETIEQQDGSPVGSSEPLSGRMKSIDRAFHSNPIMNCPQPQQQQQQQQQQTQQLPATNYRAPPLPTFAQKLRFHIALHAPTAMIRHSDEIPITYLNKGQAYSLSIMDVKTAGT